MIHSFLIRALCKRNELPEDVITYLLFNFYFPYAQAEREKTLIDEIYRELQQKILNTDNHAKPHLILDYTYLPRFRQFLSNPLIFLDTRIKDDRIDNYVKCVKKLLFFGISVNEAKHVLIKGLTTDNLLAFDCFYHNKKLDLCPQADLDSFLARASKKITTMSNVTINDSRDFAPLIRYYLDTENDEPLLEWMTIWRKKGVNLFFAVGMITARQIGKREYLYTKQRSLGV